MSAPGSIGDEFVAQRQQAGRLQTDDRNTARHEGGGGGDDAARLHPRLVDQPGRQECAPAAERPPAVRRRQHRHAIAETGEHVGGGAQVLGLEIGVEGVGEEGDLAS